MGPHFGSYLQDPQREVKKNRLKPTNRRSKKKHDAVLVDQGMDPMYSPVDLVRSTPGSMISNPFVVQPSGMCHPPHQFSHEHVLVNNYSIVLYILLFIFLIVMGF